MPSLQFPGPSHLHLLLFPQSSLWHTLSSTVPLESWQNSPPMTFCLHSLVESQYWVSSAHAISPSSHAQTCSFWSESSGLHMPFSQSVSSGAPSAPTQVAPPKPFPQTPSTQAPVPQRTFRPSLRRFLAGSSFTIHFWPSLTKQVPVLLLHVNRLVLGQSASTWHLHRFLFPTSLHFPESHSSSSSQNCHQSFFSEHTPWPVTSSDPFSKQY
mmetsp:Transcript_18700/g.33150  ORF Transcript_18700/g.33150 Transcript_18700/m.33150 type:complete len:212 (+) Transcript_18700:695-1330(+)